MSPTISLLQLGTLITSLFTSAVMAVVIAYPAQIVQDGPSSSASLGPGGTPTSSMSMGLSVATSSSVSMGLSVVPSSSTTSSALPVSTKAAAAPNGDPCGPVVQDNPNYPNTCNLTPALVQTPAPYGINCTQTDDIAKYPALAVNWASCAASLNSICTKMEDSRTLTGIWIWSQLQEECAFGFFLPPYKGSAARPSTSRCLAIFTAISDSCSTTTTPSDYGSINLSNRPGYSCGVSGVSSQYGCGNDLSYPGSAVNVGYPSYILAQKIQPG